MLQLNDSLQNVISGLGTGKDKNAYQRYAVNHVSSEQVNAAYRSSGLCRKVHDIYPDEMTRAGRDWQGDDADVLYSEEKRLKLWPALQRMTQLARLYGGGALLLGINRGAPSDPITPEAMRPGDLQFITVLRPDQLQVTDLITDPLNPFFGEPEYYRLNDGRNTLIDPSRIIPLIGQPRPDGNGQNFWGDPLLTSLWASLSNSDLVHQTVAALLPEIKADTISIPGLGALLLSCDGEKQVQNRIAAASLMQSMFNVRLLDGGDGSPTNPGDKWETRQLNVSGFPQLMEAFVARVAAETDIPVTRLAGTSPGGLNQSGQNEQRDFEKSVSSRQERELRPVLDRLDPFLARNLGLADTPYFSFSPLSQLTEVERMGIEKMRAEAFSLLLSSGAFGQDLIDSQRLAMTESDMWPGLEATATEEEWTPPTENEE